MAKVSSRDAQVNARIVYWGAAGAGKTANLHAAYSKLRPDHRGELRTLPYIVFVPAVVMCLTLLAISFVADWMNRLSDNRESRV